MLNYGLSSFGKKSFPLITTIAFKRIRVEVDSVLLSNFGFEDISDATVAYFKAFNINYNNFGWGNYFPWKEKGSFLVSKLSKIKNHLQ
ncbi:DUF1493 family protein [Yersinia mollaretii]|uniref:DUF1493 family protein n=1 Tax=Yersinia mollaretii TaxID=33060 RepID=UPI0036F24522